MDTRDLTIAGVQRTPAIDKLPVSIVLEDTSDKYIAGVHRMDTRDLLVAGVSVLSFSFNSLSCIQIFFIVTLLLRKQILKVNHGGKHRGNCSFISVHRILRSRQMNTTLNELLTQKKLKVMMFPNCKKGNNNYSLK